MSEIYSIQGLMRRSWQFWALLCLFCVQQFDWLWIGRAVQKTRQKPRIQRDAESRIVTHTRINIFYPWNEKFEETWEPPEGTVAGSLLRDESSGEYLAVLEWDSATGCDHWLNSDKHLKDNTVQYTVCSGTPKLVDTSEKESKETELEKRPRRLENPLKGLMPTLRPGKGFFDQPPEVDPEVLFAISAGEDVDIDLEDEVLISGGDPSFLDDQKWQSNPMGEEDEPDLEDDITASGGDPTFLDDRTWGADDDDFGSDLEDDITMSGGDPSFLDDSEWDEKARKA